MKVRGRRIRKLPDDSYENTWKGASGKTIVVTIFIYLR